MHRSFIASNNIFDPKLVKSLVRDVSITSGGPRDTKPSGFGLSCAPDGGMRDFAWSFEVLLGVWLLLVIAGLLSIASDTVGP